jgi:hypothetical protein
MQPSLPFIFFRLQLPRELHTGFFLFVLQLHREKAVGVMLRHTFWRVVLWALGLSNTSNRCLTPDIGIMSVNKVDRTNHVGGQRYADGDSSIAGGTCT